MLLYTMTGNVTCDSMEWVSNIKILIIEICILY